MDILFEKTMAIEAGSVDNLFDSVSTTKVSSADSIEFTVGADSCNSIAFFGLDAYSIDLTLTDNSSTATVYEETITLLTENSTSWSEFFSQVPTYRSSVISGQMPFYADASLEVSINKSGGTAECYECVIGRRKYIGGMRTGAKFGRDWVKRAEIQVLIPRGLIDVIHKSLSDLQDVKAVFVCQNSTELEAGLLYGSIYDFNITTSNNYQAIVSLEVEGEF